MDSAHFANDPYSLRGCAITVACLVLFGAALVVVLAAIAWRLLV